MNRHLCRILLHRTPVHFGLCLAGAVLLLFLLCSCAVETQPTPSPTPAYLFASRDEALVAFEEAAALPFADICYDEQSLAAYAAVRDDILGQLRADTGTPAQWEELYGELCRAAQSLKPARGDAARIYIQYYSDLDINELDSVTELITEEYGPCSITVIPEDGSEEADICYEDCVIKERGHTSLVLPKHPFTFKLPYKTSLLGLREGRRWALLSNNYDKSLMRNQIALDLATALGCPYTSQSVMVDLYLNGVYQGCYQLIEPITDGRSRVDINTSDNEYLLELDSAREWDDWYYTTPVYGVRFSVDKPDTPTPDDQIYIDKFFTKMETALQEGDLSCIDIDSFVNCYLVLEYTKSVDGMQYSTRFFIKDGKLYAGPLWDFDLSAGNLSASDPQYYGYLNINDHGDGSGDSANGIWAANRGWYEPLFSCEEFVRQLQKRFEEVFPLLENVFAENALGPSAIDRRLEQYYDLYQRNYSGTPWRVQRVYGYLAMDTVLTYDEHIQFLKDWYSRRLSVLSDHIHNLK